MRGGKIHWVGVASRPGWVGIGRPGPCSRSSSCESQPFRYDLAPERRNRMSEASEMNRKPISTAASFSS